MCNKPKNSVKNMAQHMKCEQFVFVPAEDIIHIEKTIDNLDIIQKKLQSLIKKR